MQNITSHYSLPSAWLSNNVIANFTGMGLLHSLIAHGITGEHERTLTLPQFIMHTISLMIFCVILVYFQNKALRKKAAIGLFKNLPVFMVCVPIAFWAGYYFLYIPFDIFFMYLTIGTLNGIYLKKHFPSVKNWAFKMFLSGLLAALAGIVIGLSCYFLFIKEMKGVAMNVTLWTLISVPAGLVYGFAGKLFISQESSISTETTTKIIQ